MSFIGDRNLDMELLMLLNDNDLNAVCRVNKYAKKLCDDPIFWRKRLMVFIKLDNDKINYLMEHLHMSAKDLYIYFMKEPDIINIKIRWIDAIIERGNKSYTNLYLYLANKYPDVQPLSFYNYDFLFYKIAK